MNIDKNTNAIISSIVERNITDRIVRPSVIAIPIDNIMNAWIVIRILPMVINFCSLSAIYYSHRFKLLKTFFDDEPIEVFLDIVH